MSQRVLLVGGAPRVAIDAVRDLLAHASGATALSLAQRLRNLGVGCDLLLGLDAAPDAVAERYSDREGLERGLRAWIARHRDGAVVMSAAVNDFRLDSVTATGREGKRWYRVDEKIPSTCDEVVIRLVPADKVVDKLRGFGLRGPLVAFKFEDKTTVIDAASRLRDRIGAAFVVANSLCGAINAVVDAEGISLAKDREQVLSDIAARLAKLVA